MTPYIWEFVANIVIDIGLVRGHQSSFGTLSSYYTLVSILLVDQTSPSGTHHLVSHLDTHVLTACSLRCILRPCVVRYIVRYIVSALWQRPLELSLRFFLCQFLIEHLVTSTSTHSSCGVWTPSNQPDFRGVPPHSLGWRPWTLSIQLALLPQLPALSKLHNWCTSRIF